MAFFGLFGNDEEEVQQPQRRSGGIGSFLMGALKTGLIIIGAILTLGGIFAVSENAKKFADEHMGGTGTGTLDLIKNSWEGLKSMVGLGSKNPKPEGAKNETINGISFPVPDKQHLKNAVSEDPKVFKEMGDVISAKAYQRSAAVPTNEGEKGIERINQQVAQTINIGLGLDMLNKSFQDFKPTDPNAPKPPVIDLKVPALTTTLDEYGARKFQTWKDSSPLQKINMLIPLVNAQSKEPQKLAALENIELSSFSAQRNNMERKIDSTQNITKLEQAVTIPDHIAKHYPNSPITTLFGDDKEFFNSTKLAIKTLRDKSRFAEAETITTQAEEMLKRMQVNIRDKDKDRGQYYVKAIAEIGQIRTDVTQLKDDYISPESRSAFGSILNKTVANLYIAAQEAPVILEQYRTQLDNYKTYTDSMKTTTPAVSSTSTPTPNFGDIMRSSYSNGNNRLDVTGSLSPNPISTGAPPKGLTK
ncbi:MAG: hypothetical protein ABL867_05265 [Rickettsiales bacterium]